MADEVEKDFLTTEGGVKIYPSQETEEARIARNQEELRLKRSESPADRYSKAKEHFERTLTNATDITQVEKAEQELARATVDYKKDLETSNLLPIAKPKRYNRGRRNYSRTAMETD